MGQTTAELEREIAEQRRLIEQRLGGIRERLRGDAEDGRVAVSHDASRLTKETTERLQLEERIAPRPILSLATAFAGGIALGLTSEPATAAIGRTAKSSAAGTSSVANEIIGMMTGSLGGSLKDELMSYARGVLSETKDGREPQESRDDRRRDGHRPFMG